MKERSPSPLLRFRPEPSVRFRFRCPLLAVALLLIAVASHAQPLLPFAEHPKAQAILKTVDKAVAAGPFAAAWPSLERFEIPAWYRDAQVRHLHPLGRLLRARLRQRVVSAQDVPEGHARVRAPRRHLRPAVEVRLQGFHPAVQGREVRRRRVGQLFKEAGAKYVIPVAEHHDGFPMYDSDLTEWSRGEEGPAARRDRRTGRRVPRGGHRRSAHRRTAPSTGGSSTRACTSTPTSATRAMPRSTARPATSAPPRAKSEPPDEAFLDDWLLRSCEIVDKYQPQVVYFDWWICQPVFQPYLQRFAAYYYNRGAEWEQARGDQLQEGEGRSFPDGTACSTSSAASRRHPARLLADLHLVSKNSWGYVANQDYKKSATIVDDLIDIVSKNGTLLLNIGPQPDGTIPEQEQEMLRAIGRWLAVNGEAIYGTRPWKKSRRRADADRRRLVRRREAPAVHRRGFPLHHQGRRSTRSRSPGRERRSP